MGDTHKISPRRTNARTYTSEEMDELVFFNHYIGHFYWSGIIGIILLISATHWLQSFQGYLRRRNAGYRANARRLPNVIGRVPSRSSMAVTRARDGEHTGAGLAAGKEKVEMVDRHAVSIRFAGRWVTAMYRKYSIKHCGTGRFLHLGNTAQLALIAAYLTLNILLLALGAKGDIDWQAHHAAKLVYANLPLIIGLAGKNNVLCYLTGWGYESFNVLHRWSGRWIIVLSTVHIGGRIWVNVPNVDPAVMGQRYVAWGWAAFAMFIYLILMASRPIRNRFYQLFLAQHVFLLVMITVSLIIHRPQEQGWVWAGFGLYFLDTVIRLGRIFWYPYVKRLGTEEDTPLGMVTVLSDDAVRVSVRTRQKWIPGQHVYLHLPKDAWGGHPFTVSNISRPLHQDNNKVPFESTQELLIRVRGGLTKRLYDIGVGQEDQEFAAGGMEADDGRGRKRGVPLKAWTEGPYGHTTYLGEDYNTLVLIAGGSGVTYALANALDIVRRTRAMYVARAGSIASEVDLAKTMEGGLPVATKRLRFVWIVKQAEQVAWIDDHLQDMCTMAPPGLFHLSIYITRKPKEGTPLVPVMDGYVTADYRDGSTEKPRRMSTSSASAGAWRMGDPTPDDQASGETRVPHGSICEVSYGRPDIADVIHREIEATKYNDWIAVGCCGPTPLNNNVGCVVSNAVNPSAVLRGEARRNIYLNIEEFGW